MRKFVIVRGSRQSRPNARLSGSVVVRLALMAHGDDRHVARTVDLEKCDVSRAAKRDHELSQQGSIARPSLAAGNGRVFEQPETCLDCVHGTGRRRVLLDRERLQALQVLQRLKRETNPVTAHDCLLVDRPCAS